MNKVININGTEINFDAAIMLMDDDIREALAAEDYINKQDFFTAYEKAHMEKYKEEWELSKVNPVY